MTGRHTPAPWGAHPCVGMDDSWFICGPGGERICGGLIHTSPANAEFIVRAVNSHDELVEALEECSKRLRRACVSGGSDEEYADIAVERYAQIIARARGDQP